MTLALSICSFIFSFLAFVAAGWAIVQVLGWQRSTHKVVYQPVAPTKYEVDLPPNVAEAMGEPERADLQKVINTYRAAQAQGDDDPFASGDY